MFLGGDGFEIGKRDSWDKSRKAQAAQVVSSIASQFLMKYLLPLITINFNSSSNIGKNLFKTNLNIVNKKFNL